MKNLAHYSKTLAAVGTAIGVTAAAIADGTVEPAEITAMVVAWGGVLGVYSFRNAPKLP